MREYKKIKVETAVQAALYEAIKDAGSQVALAKAVNKTQSAISNYLKKGSVPADVALEIERTTGVPRTRLNPSVFVGMVLKNNQFNAV